jgi:MFS family permease
LLLTPHSWALLGLLILFFFASSMFMSQIALFLAARFSWQGHPFGATELGVIFAYAGLINMIVQGLLITQAGRFASDRVIVVVAFASMGVGFLGIAIVDAIGLLVLFLTLIILGSAFNRTTLTAELSQSVPLSRQGMIMGLNQSLMSGANIAAPLLSGALFDRGFYNTWAVAMAVIASCGAIIAAGLLAPPRAEAGRWTSLTPIPSRSEFDIPSSGTLCNINIASTSITDTIDLHETVTNPSYRLRTADTYPL